MILLFGLKQQIQVNKWKDQAVKFQNPDVLHIIQPIEDICCNNQGGFKNFKKIDTDKARIPVSVDVGLEFLKRYRLLLLVVMIKKLFCHNCPKILFNLFSICVRNKEEDVSDLIAKGQVPGVDFCGFYEDASAHIPSAKIDPAYVKLLFLLGKKESCICSSWVSSRSR